MINEPKKTNSTGSETDIKSKEDPTNPAIHSEKGLDEREKSISENEEIINYTDKKKENWKKVRRGFSVSSSKEKYANSWSSLLKKLKDNDIIRITEGSLEKLNRLVSEDTFKAKENSLQELREKIKNSKTKIREIKEKIKENADDKEQSRKNKTNLYIEIIELNDLLLKEENEGEENTEAEKEFSRVVEEIEGKIEEKKLELEEVKNTEPGKLKELEEEETEYKEKLEKEQENLSELEEKLVELKRKRKTIDFEKLKVDNKKIIAENKESLDACQKELGEGEQKIIATLGEKNNKELEQREQEIKLLNDKIRALELGIGILNKEFGELKEINSEIEKELSDLEEQKKLSETSLEFLEEKHAEELKSLEIENEKKTEELEAIKGRLGLKGELKDSIVKERLEKTLGIADLTDTVVSSQLGGGKKITELLDEKAKEITKLGGEKNELSEKIEEYEKGLGQYFKSDTIPNNWKDLLINKAEEVIKSGEKVSDLDRELAAINLEKETLKKNLTDERGKTATLSAEKTRLEAANKELSEKNKELETAAREQATLADSRGRERDAADKTRKEALEKQTRAEKEREEALDNLTKYGVENPTKIHDLEEEVKNLLNIIGVHEDETYQVHNLREEILKITNNVNNLYNEKNKLKGDNSDLNTRNGVLTLENADLKKEKNTLTESNNTKDRQARDAENKLRTEQDNHHTTKRELNGLKDKLHTIFKVKEEEKLKDNWENEINQWKDIHTKYTAQFPDQEPADIRTELTAAQGRVNQALRILNLENGGKLDTFPADQKLPEGKTLAQILADVENAEKYQAELEGVLFEIKLQIRLKDALIEKQRSFLNQINEVMGSEDWTFGTDDGWKTQVIKKEFVVNNLGLKDNSELTEGGLRNRKEVYENCEKMSSRLQQEKADHKNTKMNLLNKQNQANNLRNKIATAEQDLGVSLDNLTTELEGKTIAEYKQIQERERERERERDELQTQLTQSQVEANNYKEQLEQQKDYSETKQERDQLKIELSQKEIEYNSSLQQKEAQIITKIINELKLGLEKESKLEQVLDKVKELIVNKPDTNQETDLNILRQQVAEKGKEIEKLKNREGEHYVPEEIIKGEVEKTLKLLGIESSTYKEELSKITSYQELEKFRQMVFKKEINKVKEQRNKTENSNTILRILLISSLLITVLSIIRMNKRKFYTVRNRKLKGN